MLGPTRLHETFDGEAGEVRLSHAGGQLDEEAAFAEFDCVVDVLCMQSCWYGTNLASFAFADVVVGDRDGGERLRFPC